MLRQERPNPFDPWRWAGPAIAFVFAVVLTILALAKVPVPGWIVLFLPVLLGLWLVLWRGFGRRA